jgi:hypothetical protein
VRFEAFVYEDGRGAPTSIAWKLGTRVLGTGSSFTRRDLPPGEHSVTVTATFADGATVEDRIALTVTNQPPRVEIVAPAAGTAVQQSETLTFRGESSDVNQPADGYRLRDAQVSWWLDGTRFATGHVASRDFSDVTPGRHTITFRGDDGLARVERSIPIEVVANTENRPPEVRITSPANNAELNVEGRDPATGTWYRDVRFTVSARDPEDDPLTYAWSDRIDGGAETVLAARGSSATLRLTWERCGGSTHDVRVRVTDAAGQSAFDTVRVHIDGVPC